MDESAYSSMRQRHSSLIGNLSWNGPGGLTDRSNYWGSTEINATKADEGYWATGGDQLMKRPVQTTEVPSDSLPHDLSPLLFRPSRTVPQSLSYA